MNGVQNQLPTELGSATDPSGRWDCLSSFLLWFGELSTPLSNRDMEVNKGKN